MGKISTFGGPASMFAKRSRRAPRVRKIDPFGNNRSGLMSQIRSRNTMFENVIFDQLKKCGLEFQTHCREVAGTPDIVQINRRRAVFLDSDFWHGWRYPVWAASLKSDFWRQKIERTRKRDKLIMGRLRRAGWRVRRIWVHELGREYSRTIDKMRRFL